MILSNSEQAECSSTQTEQTHRGLPRIWSKRTVLTEDTSVHLVFVYFNLSSLAYLLKLRTIKSEIDVFTLRVHAFHVSMRKIQSFIFTNFYLSLTSFNLYFSNLGIINLNCLKTPWFFTLRYALIKYKKAKTHSLTDRSQNLGNH